MENKVKGKRWGGIQKNGRRWCLMTYGISIFAVEGQTEFLKDFMTLLLLYYTQLLLFEPLPHVVLSLDWTSCCSHCKTVVLHALIFNLPHTFTIQLGSYFKICFPNLLTYISYLISNCSSLRTLCLVTLKCNYNISNWMKYLLKCNFYSTSSYVLREQCWIMWRKEKVSTFLLFFDWYATDSFFKFIPVKLVCFIDLLTTRTECVRFFGHA